MASRRILPPIEFNIISPHNNDVVHSHSPLFSFQLTEKVGGVKYVIEVSDTADFSGIVHTYSQIESGISPQLLVHADGNQGDIAFTDSSPSAHTITNPSSFVIKTDQLKVIGKSSALSPYDSGVYQEWRVADHTDFDIDYVAFTIEAHLRDQEHVVNPILPRMAQKTGIVGGGLTGWHISMDANNVPRFLLWQAGVLKIDMLGQVDRAVERVFRHVAVVGYDRPNRPVALFVDGLKAAEVNGNYPVANTGNLNFCRNVRDYKSIWNDEFRFLRGVSRYDADFIPYSTPFINAPLPFGDVSEWPESDYPSMEIASFAPPVSRSLPEGVWYWRAKAYPHDYSDTALAETEVRKFTITQAAYPWRVGISGSEVEFIPSNTTVSENIVRHGRRQIIKRKFKVDFAHMSQDKRDELYTEFQRRHALKFYDNMGNDYWVYWGESDRSLDGTAHQPERPVFGIDRSNMIAGALRWLGTAVFSEV